LTSGSTASANGLQLIIGLTVADLNAIRALSPLFTSTSSAYMSFTSALILDMANNAVAAVSNTAALQAASFITDSQQPTLLSFDFNLNAGTIILTFSKTMNVSTLAVAGIGFQKGPASVAADQYQLTNAAATSTSLSPIFTVQVSKADIDNLKLKRIGVSSASTWITMTAGTIADTVGNALIPLVDNANSMQVHTYTSDTTSPTLTGFSLSVNDPAQLTLSFSEPVVVASLAVTGLTLANSASVAPAVTLALAAGDASTASVDGSVIVLSLSVGVLNRIKDQAGFGKSDATTFLSLTSATVTDIVGNAVTAIGLANAVGAASYVADTTAPQVTAFQLDMDGAGSITLTFSESVDPSSIRFDHFQIQRGGADTSASLYLSAAAVVASSTVLDTIVSAQLTLSDSNELKRLATLATSRANTYLSVQAGGIVD